MELLNCPFEMSYLVLVFIIYSILILYMSNQDSLQLGTCSNSHVTEGSMIYDLRYVLLKRTPPEREPKRSK